MVRNSIINRFYLMNIHRHGQGISTLGSQVWVISRFGRFFLQTVKGVSIFYDTMQKPVLVYFMGKFLKNSNLPRMRGTLPTGGFAKIF